MQKAVELGVVAIQPLFTERSGVALSGERLDRKVQHWRGIVIGGCEQCGRNRLPEVREPLTLTTWLLRSAEPGLRLLLDPLAERGLRGLEPVSYTHLDVYKRQGQELSALAGGLRGRLRMANSLAWAAK